MSTRTLLGATLLLGALSASPVLAGDGLIDWDHISHLPRFDRVPACPVDQQAFGVRLLTAPGDVDAVRVRFVDGAGAWITAIRTPGATRDEWRADLPAAAGTRASYWFELSDGVSLGFLGPLGHGAAPPADSGWVIDFTTLEHAPRGATALDGGGVVFRVWAPMNSGVVVQGEFNGWASATLMAPVGSDFIARIPAARVGQQYKFEFTNGWWNPDPWGTGLRDDTYGGYNSFVDTVAFAWHDEDFTPAASDRMVIYALATEEFAGLADPLGTPAYPSAWRDVTARLGHLQELGVNAVQLSPVIETSNVYPMGGYQPVSQWAAEATLGTSTRLRELVQAAHDRGIAVLFDLVWTHMAYYDDFLASYGGFTTWYADPPAQSGWGAQLDFARPEVREYLVESAVRWIEEFHADGLRLFGVPLLATGPQAVAATGLMRDLHALLQRRGHPGLTLADVTQRTAAVTAPIAAGGLGFTAQCDHQFATALRTTLPLAGAGDPHVTGLASALLDGGPGLGAGVLHRFVEMPHASWMEEPRLIRTIAGAGSLDEPDVHARMRLALGLLMTAPGLPAVLMGDEWLEDRQLVEAVAGRIEWSKKTTNRPFFDFVRRAVALRTSDLALSAGAALELVHVDEAGDVFTFRRHDDAHEVLVAVNLGASDRPAYRVGVPVAGVWRERLNSADPLWGGEGGDNPGDLLTEAVPADGKPQSLVLVLPRLALTVLSPFGSLDVPDGPVASTRFGLARVWPNPVAEGAMADVAMPHAGTLRLDLYDVSGRHRARVADVALTAGGHRVPWSVDGLRLAPGLYVLAAETAGARAVRKVAILR